MAVHPLWPAASSAIHSIRPCGGFIITVKADARWCRYRAYNTMKHTCVTARIGDDAKRGAANMSILASRATKCPAQGGAGSKRCVLGCDPAAGQESAEMRGPHTRLPGRIPARGAPAPRFGASPILAATPCGLARVLAHDFVVSPLLSRSKRRVLLRVLSQNRASASRVSPC